VLWGRLLTCPVLWRAGPARTNEKMNVPDRIPRGIDLYQRHGGGPYTGYGDAPVALHIYEVAAP
jgi:hypothetical protein